MKDKIMIFIIGLLLGAIISTASIFVYTKANNNDNNSNINNGMRMNGNRGSMPSDNSGMEQPPERPDANNQMQNNENNIN